MNRSCFAAAVLLCALPASAENDRFADLAPLLGRWTGEGTGQPGEGKGGFTLERDLQGGVLLRHNRAEYPAQQGKPAFTHTDLMIIFREGDQTRAHYYDNEGHFIDYQVTVADQGKRIVFLSEPKSNAPRFRLSYLFDRPGHVSIEFEIAPPGKPGAFRRYITASAKKET